MSGLRIWSGSANFNNNRGVPVNNTRLRSFLFNLIFHLNTLSVTLGQSGVTR